jgi:hypothetical protein
MKCFKGSGIDPQLGMRLPVIEVPHDIPDPALEPWATAPSCDILCNS